MKIDLTIDFKRVLKAAAVGLVIGAVLVGTYILGHERALDKPPEGLMCVKTDSIFLLINFRNMGESVLAMEQCNGEPKVFKPFAGQNIPPIEEHAPSTRNEDLI